MNIKTTLLRNLLPTIRPMIPQALPLVEEALMRHIDTLPLRDGESRASLILIKGKDNHLYAAEAYTDTQDKIIRLENVQLAITTLQQLIDKSL